MIETTKARARQDTQEEIEANARKKQDVEKLNKKNILLNLLKERIKVQQWDAEKSQVHSTYNDIITESHEKSTDGLTKNEKIKDLFKYRVKEKLQARVNAQKETVYDSIIQ